MQPELSLNISSTLFPDSRSISKRHTVHITKDMVLIVPCRSTIFLYLLFQYLYISNFLTSAVSVGILLESAIFFYIMVGTLKSKFLINL